MLQKYTFVSIKKQALNDENGRLLIGAPCHYPVIKVIIYSGMDKFWLAESPSLSACISQGDTKELAISNIKETIKIYIKALEEDNLTVPIEKLNTIMLAV